MVTTFDPTTLGVSGVIVGILLYILRVLWGAFQDERKGRIDDARATLPVLERAAQELADAARREADRAADARARRGDG